jgi:tetratricopeptide (TPR) repeat protein
MDEQLGRLVDAFRGWAGTPPAVLVASDHGEGLGDHGESEHGIFLYREALRVPLVIKLPSSRDGGSRVSAPVQLIDLFPTINALTGVEPAAKLPGASLLDVRDGKFADRRIYGETMYPRIHLGLSDLASLVDGTHHYIDAPRPELFDLKADPNERRSVLAGQRRVYAAMSSELKQFDRTLKAPANISPEEAAKLAALGYLSRPVGTGDALGDPKDHIVDVEEARKAAELTSRGKFDPAIAILKPLLQRSPRFADGWTQLGLAYERSGRAEEAIAAYRRTIELAPMLASESAISIGELYLATGRVDEAIDHAKLALTSYPGPAHALLARAYLARRDLPAVEREARWLMDDPTRRAEGMVAMAEVHVAAKRLDEAQTLLSAAVQEIESGRSADVPMLRFVQGDLLARRGDFAGAQRSFGEEIRRFPRNREAYVRLAALQILQGDVRGAEATLSRMVAAVPGKGSYVAAAETLERLGQRDRAARWREGAK